MRRFENHIPNKLMLLATVVVLALSQPNSATADPSTDLLKKAQALLEQRKTDAALACLNTLIKQQPKNALAYIERSRAHVWVGKHDKALADSNKAIALKPRLASAYTNRAAIYTLTARYQKALADSSKALELQPRLAMAYLVRALVYERLKLYQKEIEECNKAIAIAPKTARYYIIRAFAYRGLGQYQSALQDCNKALSLASKDEIFYRERGSVYSRLGKFQKAVDDYSAAIKIVPQSAETYLLRADAFSKLGQFHKQIDDLTLAIKFSPKDADLYERRGGAHYQLGQLKNAVADCSMAMNLNPISSAAYDTAADAYEELGLYDKALEFRTKFLEFDIKDAYRWNARAKVYERLGKHDLALADRQKVNELASPSDRLYMQGCSPLIDFNKLSDANERLKDSIEMQLKNKSVVLPFDYDGEGHFSVPARVNGQPLRLMLDTGCGHSDLWKQAMPGVAEVDKTLLRGTNASGKEYNFGSFRARDLRLGDLNLSNVAMAANDGLVGHKTIGGFLGGNILENFVVSIDYEKKQVTLANSIDLEKSKNAVIVPMGIRKHQPHCLVTLDEKLEVSALLDTGCPFSMSADSLLKPILAKKLDYKEHMSGPWLGELSCEGVRFKTVGLGGANFEAPIFDVYPAAEAPAAASTIILGNDFLSGFRSVTFDYPNRRVIFEPDETISKSATHFYREGRFFLAHKDERRAIDAFSSAIDLDKAFAPLCYFYRGLAFEHLKQYQEAIADCNALIRLDAKASWAYHLRALVYHDLGQHRLAENDLKMEKKLHGH